MRHYTHCLRALVWQATHVIRLSSQMADEVRVRNNRYPTRVELAELRDQLAKMALRREEIESWLDSFDDDFRDEEDDEA